MKLLKPIVIISLITAFSRVLGFIRDTIIAETFGTGAMADAFFMAFKLPNLFRRIFAEGAFLQVFVPILSEYRNVQGKNATRAFISYVSGLLILSLVLITVLGMMLSPWLVTIIAPGFIDTTNKFVLTTKLFLISFPYIILISLASMISSILNAWDYFFIPAFAPVFLNVSMIGFMLFTLPYFNPPILALAWSIITGGILQLIYQLPYLKKIDMLILPRINFYDAGILRVVKQMGSALLGVSVSQVSLIINTIFSSFLVSGSISWMYYADRLMEFPSGIFGVSLGTILLPALSKSFINGNCKMYSRLMDWGLRLCFFLALPSSIALGILSKPLTISLFQYGKFTAFDVLMIQKAIIAYSIGLIGLIVSKVLLSGFYSRQDIKTPVKVTVITVVITQLINPVFIILFKHAGLSLSVGFSACLNAILLYWQLRRKKIYTPQPGWICFFFHLIISVLIMAIVLVGILYIIPEWSIVTMPYRLLRLLIVVLIGIITYLLTLIILGFKIKRLIQYNT